MCGSKVSLERSRKNNSHHDSDASLFSQSTPEKSRLSNYVDSSPDAFDTSETKLFKHKFHDDFHQIGKNCLKFNQRSRSETSLCDFKRSISSAKYDNHMDISSDVSMHFSRDQSLRGHSALGEYFTCLSRAMKSIKQITDKSIFIIAYILYLLR